MTASAVLSVGDLVLDTSNRRLSGPAGTVKMEAGAFTVLKAIMLRPGHVFTLGELVSVVWPDPAVEPDRNPEHAVRERISRARWAMNRVGIVGRRLVNQRGEGYGLLGERTVGRAFLPAEAKVLDQLLTMRPSIAAVVQELSQAETMPRAAA